MKMVRTVAVPLLVAICGFAVFWFGTDGGKAWTSEIARRVAITENTPSIPNVVIDDVTHGRMRLAEINSPIVLLEFIFTRCPTVCNAMAAEFRELQTALQTRGLANHVRLVSITFDREDTQAMLAAYLKRFASEANQWSAAQVVDPAELESLLHTLGVVVIPEQSVGFVHNAAVYVLKDGKVVAVMDFNQRQQLLRFIESTLGVIS